MLPGKLKRSESDASHLISVITAPINSSSPISEVEVRPNEQPHISLGNFTNANAPKGFAIHIMPNPKAEAIVTQATRLGTNDKYELVLHVANYGDKTVSAEIWQL